MVETLIELLLTFFNSSNTVIMLVCGLFLLFLRKKDALIYGIALLFGFTGEFLLILGELTKFTVILNFISAVSLNLVIIFVGYFYIYVLFSESPKFKRFQILVGSIIILIIALCALFVESVHPEPLIRSFTVIRIILVVFNISMYIIFFLSFNRLFKKHIKIKNEQGADERRHLRYLFYGLLINFIGGLFYVISRELANLFTTVSMIIVTISFYRIYKKEREIGDVFSKLRNVQQELNEQKERYRIFLNNFRGIAYKISSHNEVLFYHGNVKKITGYSEKNLIKGKPNWIEIVHQDDLSKYENVFLSGKKNSSSNFDLEYRIVRKDGNVRWVNDRNQRIIDENGNFISIQGTIYDISNRKIAEKKEREEKEKFKIISEQSLMGIMIVQDNFIKYANKTAAEIYEHTIEEMINWKQYSIPEKFVHPDDRDFVREQGQKKQTGKNGYVSNYSLRIIPKPGMIKWIEIFSKTIVFNGEFANLVTMVDITEEKKVKEDLYRSEKRYRNLFESSHDAIMTLAPPEWKFTSCNQATLDMFEAKNEKELTSLGPWNVSPEFQPNGRSSSEQAKKMIETAMQNGNHYFEWTHKGLNGTVFPATVLLTRVEIENESMLQATIRDITESKKTIEKLKESEEKYRTVIEKSNDGIMIIQDSIIQYVNPAMCKMVGYSFEEYLGKPYTITIHPDEMSKVTERYKKRMFGEEIPKIYESVMIDKNENMVDVEYNACLIPYKGKTANLTIVRNISERKKTENKLQNERDRAQNYLDLAGVIFLGIDTKGKVILVNKKGCEVLGYAEEEVLGKNWFENFIPERFRDKIIPISKKLLTGEKEPAEYGENPVLTKGGNERIIAWHNSIIKGDNGRIIGHLSSGEDITERKHAEEKLRKSEKVLKQAEKVARIGSFKWDVKTNQIEGSEEFFHICGVNPKQSGKIDTSLINKLMHPDDINKHQELFVKAILGKKTEPFEFRIILSDGTQRNILSEASLVYDNNGYDVSLIGYMQDITERKKAEEKLNQKTQELERSNEDLQQFAYIASHDLKEPLRTVSGYIKLLKLRYGADLDEKGQKYLNSSMKGLKYMENLIVDLLKLSRVETNAKKFKIIDFNAVMDAVLSNLKSTIEEKEAKILINDFLPSVMGDYSQLVQLMQNLVSNAIKFIKNKTPEINIGVIQKNDTWHIYVRDNGIGIDPENFEKIFIIFKRLHSRTEFSGTGIGLSICKKIVEHHGGRIWVESELGKGSTFYFSLSIITDKKLIVNQIRKYT
ncbi:MAG: PAS domain-containing sensor histidine kinase [Promethearchaeota archaeon]